MNLRKTEVTERRNKMIDYTKNNRGIGQIQVEAVWQRKNISMHLYEYLEKQSKTSKKDV